MEGSDMLAKCGMLFRNETANVVNTKGVFLEKKSLAYGVPAPRN